VKLWHSSTACAPRARAVSTRAAAIVRTFLPRARAPPAWGTRLHERRESVVALPVHVRAQRHEHLHHRSAAAVRRHVQRRRADAGPGIGVGSAADQRVDAVLGPRGRSEM